MGALVRLILLPAQPAMFVFFWMLRMFFTFMLNVVVNRLVYWSFYLGAYVVARVKAKLRSRNSRQGWCA